MGGKTANKAGYFDKLKGLLEEYNSIFIVTVDNVSSQQMHEIRQSLRGEGVVLMGKNTMVRFEWRWESNGMSEVCTNGCIRSAVPSRPSSPRTQSTSASCRT
jgi:hypothetical protein